MPTCTPSFGSPIAYEDDAARACWSALELLALEGETAATGLTVGIATGRLRSGTYGSRQRRTFCCLGDAVNLAARLMAAAPAGSAWASEEVRRRVGDAFVWDELPALQVKGKAGPVPVAALVDRRRGAPSLAGRHAGPLLGRAAELRMLLGAAGQAATGQGQVVRLTAEAGLGKSRLLAALGAELGTRGVVVHEGVAPAFGARGSYGGWQGLVRTLLGVPEEAGPAAVVAHLDQVLGRTAPDLLPRLPLLGSLLGVELPDSPLTATFDARLRKTSLEALVLQYLEARREEGLLVLVLEDAQWLDPLSRELLQAVARAAPRLPLLLLAARRPPGPDEPDPLEGLAVRELGLPELAPDTSLALLRLRYEELTGHDADDVRTGVLPRLVERGQGNPFHLEELLGHLVDRGTDLRAASSDALDLPVSLQRLVLQRVDDLPEEPRRTLKVASVAGRRFTSTQVAAAYPDLGDEDDVQGNLADLSVGALVLAEPAPRTYAFRHAMTEEVAYASLPFAIRSSLHDRYGRWLEQTDAALDLLAHHFARGTDEQRKRTYLLRAGAAAQERYANDTAVDYYRRALEVVTEPDERAALLERLGRVLELSGDWPGAATAYAEALALHRTAGSRQVPVLLTELAEVARKQGRFGEAADRLQEARAAGADEAVLGRVLHLEGTLASQQGRYAEARAAYGRSLVVRERLADRASVGALLSNLAVVAEQEGDLGEAQRLGEQALAVREEVGDPWAVCVSHNNLGMVALLQHDPDTARGHIAESMRLAALVGDLWMVAVGEHNLGNALVGLGDLEGAGRRYLAALRTYLEHDDAWTLALLVEDVVVLALRSGRPTQALRLLGAADALRAGLAAPRAPAVEAALDALLDEARGSAEAELFAADGAALDRPAVVALVSEVCGRTLPDISPNPVAAPPPLL